MTNDSNAANPTEFHIYADGACSGNPGKGGYGVVIIKDGQRQEFSGGFRHTTNNRMEILGAIVGLRSLSGGKSSVTIHSDSKYLVDMFNGGHAGKWRKKGWRLSKNKPAKNHDLWNELLTLAEEHEVKMVWVRGHGSNKENARCDELAVEARMGGDLPTDEGYVNPVLPVVPEIPVTNEPTLFDWFR